MLRTLSTCWNILLQFSLKKLNKGRKIKLFVPFCICKHVFLGTIPSKSISLQTENYTFFAKFYLNFLAFSFSFRVFYTTPKSWKNIFQQSFGVHSTQTLAKTYKIRYIFKLMQLLCQNKYLHSLANLMPLIVYFPRKLYNWKLKLNAISTAGYNLFWVCFKFLCRPEVV